MFLKFVCLVFIGGAWTLEDETFAHTGSIFCFDFVAKVVPTGSNCSVTKYSTKTILFYDSDNRNVTIEPEYLGRVVNATFDGSGSIKFCLQGLTQTDSGTYTNNCNSSSGGITLTVIDLISDVKIEQPDTKPAIAGYSYSLRCTVAPLTANIINISWWFVNNSTQIVENDNFEFRADKRVLEILDVKQSFMSAHFMCSVSNVLGQRKNSQQYFLNIVVKPEVQLNEKTISAVVGQPFFTDCRATGFPSPSVQWTKNNTVVPQIQVSDSYSILVIQNVTSVTNAIYTCLANVSYGSLILQANESFTLQPYDVENSKVDDFFLNDADYKYAMFLLNLLGFCLMILALAIAAILWKWWGNGKRLKEHIKQNSIKLEELKPEKEAKLMKAFKAMKRSKKECRKSPQYPHFDDEKPLHFLYDEISEVRVPTLPKKKNSLMNMKNSYKIITKARCKKQKYRFNDAKRKTLNAPPTLDPQEYSGLKERTSGPNVYDDMNGPTKKNMSTFDTADSRLKSSNSSSYLEILADVDKQQTDSVIYSEVKRETAAERDIISEEN